MDTKENPAAGQTADGASGFVQVARLNFPEITPDSEQMQAAPGFDPAGGRVMVCRSVAAVEGVLRAWGIPLRAVVA